MPMQVGTEYGVCRVSTRKQNIQRQIREVLSQYPNAIIVQDKYTGTKIERKKRVREATKSYST